ncbi:MAG TPA: cupin domain-containing protein [Sandaracinaceae bacterium LLY-WYZ-13_1]|nr:cupin domain-containing protein [Sandaracinaceae bacterium LLY-WYZ-13_1]
MSRMITGPTSFVVEDYAPGLTIDFADPPRTTDLDRLREGVDLEPWRGLDTEALLGRADALCRELDVAERPGDLVASVRRFTGASDPTEALARAAAALGEVPDEATPFDHLRAILDTTGVLSRPDHHAVRVRCHDPAAPSRLDAGHTHFGYVLDGDALTLTLDDGRRYPLYPRTTFCVPEPGAVEGAGRVLVLSRLGFRGAFTLGGPVEPWGRLRYIDGCTDTVLVPPVKLGDPCLNALYFPAHTEQTQHTHPSLRAGVVIDGRGVCKTPGGDHALAPGKVFLLPPECWHAFHTADGDRDRAALTVLAFHPDSDFGPTDDDHPMLNRTYVRFLHRLRSAARSARA